MAFPICPVHGVDCDGNHHHQRHQSDHQPLQRDRKFRLTMQNCSDFLVEVKRTLPQETYKEFIQTARDLKNSGCKVLEVARKMETVLVDQPWLLNLFCNFLPESERLRFFKSLPGYPRAFAFIHKVKTLLSNETHRHESFVAVLQQIKNRSLQEIADEVAEILGNHNDLVEEFKTFLPSDSSHTEHLSSHQSLNPQNEGETSTAIAHRKMVSIVKEKSQKSQQMHILEEGNGEDPDYKHPTQDEVDDQHDEEFGEAPLEAKIFKSS